MYIRKLRRLDGELPEPSPVADDDDDDEEDEPAQRTPVPSRERPKTAKTRSPPTASAASGYAAFI